MRLSKTVDSFQGRLDSNLEQTVKQTGRRKLGRIYAQPVQKRPGRVSVCPFQKTLSFNVYLYFMGPGLKPDEFNISSIKTAS